MAKKSHGTTVDVVALKDRMKAVGLTFDEQIEALKKKKVQAQQKEIEGLKEERGKMQADRNNLDISIRKIQTIIDSLSSKTSKGSGQGRTKRKSAQMNEQAGQVADWLKKNAGSTASEIEEATKIDLTQNVKKFIERAGVKVTMDGDKSTATYSIK